MSASTVKVQAIGANTDSDRLEPTKSGWVISTTTSTTAIHNQSRATMRIKPTARSTKRCKLTPERPISDTRTTHYKSDHKNDSLQERPCNDTGGNIERRRHQRQRKSERPNSDTDRMEAHCQSDSATALVATLNACQRQLKQERRSSDTDVSSQPKRQRGGTDGNSDCRRHCSE